MALGMSAIVGVASDKVFPGSDTIRLWNRLPANRAITETQPKETGIGSPKFISGIYLRQYTGRSIADILAKREIFSPEKSLGSVLLCTFSPEDSRVALLYDYMRVLFRVHTIVPGMAEFYEAQSAKYQKFEKINPANNQKRYLELDREELGEDIESALYQFESYIARATETRPNVHDVLLELRALADRAEDFHHTTAGGE